MSFFRSKKRFLPYLSLVLGLLSLLILFWGNYHFVKENQTPNDFLYKWAVTRDFILSGRSPYQENISLEVRTMVAEYGQQDLDDIPRFDLPFYATFVYIPFAAIENFSIGRALWLTFLEISMIIMAMLTLKVVGWQISKWLLPIYILFSIFWFFGLQGIIDGNLAILISLLVACSLFMIREQHDLAGGLFLATATMRPRLTILLVIATLIWSVSRGNWRFVRWFFVWLILFIGLGMLFIPDWVLQNIRVVINMRPVTVVGTFGEMFESWLPGIGMQLNWGSTILFCLMMVIEWWFSKRKDFRHFIWTAGFTFTIGQLIGFLVFPGDAILLFLPLAIIFAVFHQRWKKLGIIAVLFSLVLIMGVVWVLVLEVFGRQWQIFDSYLLILPITLFNLVGMYWVHWWAIRPITVLSDISANGKMG
jgi:hypothetical protein